MDGQDFPSRRIRNLCDLLCKICSVYIIKTIEYSKYLLNIIDAVLTIHEGV